MYFISENVSALLWVAVSALLVLYVLLKVFTKIKGLLKRNNQQDVLVFIQTPLSVVKFE